MTPELIEIIALGTIILAGLAVILTSATIVALFAVRALNRPENTATATPTTPSPGPARHRRNPFKRYPRRPDHRRPD